MNRSRQDLIGALSSNLEPVAPPPAIGRLACAWLALCLAFVLAAILVRGPLRPGVLTQLGLAPQFLASTLLGVLAIGSITLLAFRAAIPGRSNRSVSIGVTVLLLAWWGSFGLDLIVPALEPSMLGKRAHCWLEGIALAMPGTMAALVLTRRLYPLRPVWSAFQCGLAAALLPALAMQLACMYEPLHNLLFHLAPALFVALLSAAVAALRLRSTAG